MHRYKTKKTAGIIFILGTNSKLFGDKNMARQKHKSTSSIGKNPSRNPYVILVPELNWSHNYDDFQLPENHYKVLHPPWTLNMGGKL